MSLGTRDLLSMRWAIQGESRVHSPHGHLWVQLSRGSQARAATTQNLVGLSCCKLRKIYMLCENFIYTGQTPVPRCLELARLVGLTELMGLAGLVGAHGALCHEWQYLPSYAPSSCEALGPWDPSLTAGLGGGGERRRQPLWHSSGSPPVPTSFPLGHIISSPSSTAVCSSVSSSPVPPLPHIPVSRSRYPVVAWPSVPFPRSCSPGMGPIAIDERQGRYASGVEASAGTLPCLILPHPRFWRVLAVSDPAFAMGVSSRYSADSTIRSPPPWILVLAPHSCQIPFCTSLALVLRSFVVPHALAGCAGFSCCWSGRIFRVARGWYP